MISNSGHIQSIAGIYLNSIDKTAAKPRTNIDASKIDGGDKIVLSNESQEFSSYLNKLRSMPDVRIDKVNFYSVRISNNDYKIDSQKIAEKILNG
ncbi:flagellar biosynthesis anti-sigma factor FlgM [Pectinatus frisingensis]|uniref:flagellar biosynthesis anti-sigma factor FlgM n=1 Tax=Pectinatus frisingensis TaxID=865 RepID=UPI0018C82646|nr:flagellar biosynthesis anti-sigma factor FlgM [Pectinatus frisingensis]